MSLFPTTRHAIYVCVVYRPLLALLQRESHAVNDTEKNLNLLKQVIGSRNPRFKSSYWSWSPTLIFVLGMLVHVFFPFGVHHSGRTQQDAHELFTEIVDMMTDELYMPVTKMLAAKNATLLGTLNLPFAFSTTFIFFKSQDVFFKCIFLVFYGRQRHRTF